MEGHPLDAPFAHCVALTVDAVFRPHDRRSAVLGHADILASAIDLDVNAAGWKPTADAYFLRISKAQILEAVREAKGDDAAARLEGLKKPEMAAAAGGTASRNLLAPAGLRCRRREEAPEENSSHCDDAPSVDDTSRRLPSATISPASAAIAAE
ncbi:MAG: hypothetical protein R3C54_01780 [Parvularculaceae bacterium]